MLDYLFQQLLQNAIKFQEKDNHPVIDIRSDMVTSEDFTGNREAYYEISIRDNGIGFEPEDAERIFGMFERLHKDAYRGSGIGLNHKQKDNGHP